MCQSQSKTKSLGRHEVWWSNRGSRWNFQPSETQQSNDVAKAKAEQAETLPVRRAGNGAIHRASSVISAVKHFYQLSVSKWKKWLLITAVACSASFTFRNKEQKSFLRCGAISSARKEEGKKKWRFPLGKAAPGACNGRAGTGMWKWGAVGQGYVHVLVGICLCRAWKLAAELKGGGFLFGGEVLELNACCQRQEWTCLPSRSSSRSHPKEKVWIWS